MYYVRSAPCDMVRACVYDCYWSDPSSINNVLVLLPNMVRESMGIFIKTNVNLDFIVIRFEPLLIYCILTDLLITPCDVV